MKILLFISVCLFCFFTTIKAQQCGGDIRTIRFGFEKNVKKPNKIYYKLYYLMPKRADRYLNYAGTHEEFAIFLSNFLYKNSNPPNNYFWITLGYDAKFIEVSSQKAHEYLKDYNFKDFEGRWSSENYWWFEHHLPQLWGNTCNSILEFETRETDYTPFLLEINAKDFVTLYFVSNFLGGCFVPAKDKPKPFQRIQMRKLLI